MKHALSLYIHIPFCPQKCHYCGFLSGPSCAADRIEYVQALIREIQTTASSYQDYNVETIYCGGGCPTLLSHQQWTDIVRILQVCFHWTKQVEWTFEIHPVTVGKNYLYFLNSLGVNRLSFGVQSFNKQVRGLANRKGSVTQANDLIRYARAIGYRNISVDLILGLPNQSLYRFKQDVLQALKLQPAHISIYFLSLEQGTVFYTQQEQFSFPQEGDIIACYQYACSYLHKQGFIHYEVSNWAQKGFECRHNYTYWKRKAYLGLGLGAHTFISNRRYHNTDLFHTYCQGNFQDESSLYSVPAHDALLEYLMLSLRTRDGASFSYLSQHFGEKATHEIINSLKNSPYRKLISMTDKRFRVKEIGWLLLDSIIGNIS